MVRNWVTALALCTTIVAASGSIALSQGFPTPRNGEAFVPPVQSGGSPAAIRAPLGDPPPLPGAASPSNPGPDGRRQPAAIAPRLAQPQLGNMRQPSPLGPAQRAGDSINCPFGSDNGFVCDYDSRTKTAAAPHAFSDDGFGRPFNGLRQPPIPDGFNCESGSCPLDTPFGRRPAHVYRP